MEASPSLKVQKSNTGATGSRTRSSVSIKPTPNKVFIQNEFVKNSDILPVIKINMHQLIPIRKGTSSILGPRTAP